MLKRPLGSSGIEASAVAFGAWAIGGWKWGGTDAEASVSAIRASLDSGVTLIDTAPVYGFGLSEEIVGKAIAGRRREDIIVATKCGLVWDRESATLHAQTDGRRIYRTLSADSIREELNASLQRLGVDYIDLYQTHWPDPASDMHEVAETLDALKREGLVRAVGFCNASPAELKRSADLLDTDQERYSLLDRDRETDNLPVCLSDGLAFLAYSPIAQGLLTGRIDAKREFADTDLRSGNPRFQPRVLDAIDAVLAPVKSLARERGVPTERLVLAWTLAQPGVSHVLAGTRSVEQAETNAAASELVLHADEIKVIDQAAATWPGFETLTEPQA